MRPAVSRTIMAISLCKRAWIQIDYIRYPSRAYLSSLCWLILLPCSSQKVYMEKNVSLPFLSIKLLAFLDQFPQLLHMSSYDLCIKTFERKKPRALVIQVQLFPVTLQTLSSPGGQTLFFGSVWQKATKCMVFFFRNKRVCMPSSCCAYMSVCPQCRSKHDCQYIPWLNTFGSLQTHTKAILGKVTVQKRPNFRVAFLSTGLVWVRTRVEGEGWHVGC